MLVSAPSSTALSEVQRYAEKRRLDLHYVNKEVLERMSGKRPHQVYIRAM